MSGVSYSYIYNWIKSLEQRFKVTTVKHHLIDVVEFMKFMPEERPAKVCLSFRQTGSILRLLPGESERVNNDQVGRR